MALKRKPLSIIIVYESNLNGKLRLHGQKRYRFLVLLFLL